LVCLILGRQTGTFAPCHTSNGRHGWGEGARDMEKTQSLCLTLRYRPVRSCSCEPGQALIGAALSRKHGAYRVSGTEDNRVNFRFFS